MNDIYIIILSFTTLVFTIVILFLYMNRKLKGLDESMRKELKSTNDALRRELRGINEYMSNKSNKNPETRSENSGKLGDLNKQLNDLNEQHNDLKQINEKQYTALEHKINELGQIISHMLKPDKLPVDPSVDQKQGEKIWVQKTADGLKKLEVSDSQKEMYLLKRNDDFFLNLADLAPSSYGNIMSLYDSILIFPAGFKTINEIIMLKNPKYSKHGDLFHFEVRGEITVN